MFFTFVSRYQGQHCFKESIISTSESLVQVIDCVKFSIFFDCRVYFQNVCHSVLNSLLYNVSMCNVPRDVALSVAIHSVQGLNVVMAFTADV